MRSCSLQFLAETVCLVRFFGRANFGLTGEDVWEDMWGLKGFILFLYH